MLLSAIVFRLAALLQPPHNTVYAPHFTYQISVFVVKIPSRKASGGIHLTGSIALPPFLFNAQHPSPSATSRPL